MQRASWLFKSEVGLLILLGFALIVLGTGSVCKRSIRQSREAVLKLDLQTLRTAIDCYTTDKKQPPQTLKDLVKDHYLREIPKNPFLR